MNRDRTMGLRRIGVARFAPAALAAAAVAAALAGPAAALAQACPFCGAVQSTLAQDILNSDASVVARLDALAPDRPANSDGELNIAPPMAKFTVIEVLKGSAKLKGTQIEAPFFDEKPLGGSYLLLGAQGNDLQWAPPYALTPRSRRYVSEIVKLPTAGPKRLEYFQNYLEDPEELLGKDAFDEFALAPYSALRDMKSSLQHDKLLERVQDASITPTHRRQYLTMLGVCGRPSDLPILENLLHSEDPKFKPGLDATVACYLVLKGPSGLPLVEDLFLKPKTDEFTDIFAVVMALRFLGQEEHGPIPRERIVASMRLVLDHPRLADQAIMDLARWGDWSVMDRLVAMFKSDDPEVNTWVRIPVINYLRSCPLPIAKQHIEELRKIDARAVQQSESVYDALGIAGGTATVPPAAAGAASNAAAKSNAPETPSTDKTSAQKSSAEQPAAADKSAAAAELPAADARDSVGASSKPAAAGSLPPSVLWSAVGVGVFGGLLLFAASVRGGRTKSNSSVASSKSS